MYVENYLASQIRFRDHQRQQTIFILSTQRLDVIFVFRHGEKTLKVHYFPRRKNVSSKFGRTGAHRRTEISELY